VLGEYEENRLTLAVLAARSFAPLDPVADFGTAEPNLYGSQAKLKPASG
jgi:hypothetical protein